MDVNEEHDSQQPKVLFGYGLVVVKTVASLTLWYIFSGLTLFSNKLVLTETDVVPVVFGAYQIAFTALIGGARIYGYKLVKKWWSNCSPIEKENEPSSGTTFVITMSILGTTRFLSVVLSLLSLAYVAVSFTETIKSSAPFFTVVMSWIVLRKRTGILINLSLIPVVGGLALTSSTELSFNMIGFVAALLNNVADCFQNVFSKKLLNDELSYSPDELQFYSSSAASILQIPFILVYLGPIAVKQSLMEFYTGHKLWLLLMNGVSFHMQSVAAYLTMSFISPVTFSVTNTAKRALLIWTSVLIFHNQVTIPSAVGTATVIVGVFLYQQALSFESKATSSTMAESPRAQTSYPYTKPP